MGIDLLEYYEIIKMKILKLPISLLSAAFLLFVSNSFAATNQESSLLRLVRSISNILIPIESNIGTIQGGVGSISDNLKEFFLSTQKIPGNVVDLRATIEALHRLDKQIKRDPSVLVDFKKSYIENESEASFYKLIEERLKRVVKDRKNSAPGLEGLDRLLAKDLYTTEGDQNDAYDFVVNSVAGPEYLPPSPDSLNNSSPDRGTLKLLAFHQAIASFRTTAAAVLFGNYIDRLPVSITAEDGKKILTSRHLLKRKLFLSNSNSEDYWNQKSGANLNLFQKLSLFIDRFFSVQYALQEIISQLTKANALLAILISENTMLMQNLGAQQFQAGSMQGKANQNSYSENTATVQSRSEKINTAGTQPVQKQQDLNQW